MENPSQFKIERTLLCLSSMILMLGNQNLSAQVTISGQVISSEDNNGLPEADPKERSGEGAPVGPHRHKQRQAPVPPLTTRKGGSGSSPFISHSTSDTDIKL